MNCEHEIIIYNGLELCCLCGLEIDVVYSSINSYNTTYLRNSYVYNKNNILKNTKYSTYPEAIRLSLIRLYRDYSTKSFRGRNRILILDVCYEILMRSEFSIRE